MPTVNIELPYRSVSLLLHICVYVYAFIIHKPSILCYHLDSLVILLHDFFPIDVKRL